MAISIFTHLPRKLASGTVVAVDKKTGKVSFPPAGMASTCFRMVEVLSGNPEPDCEADRWTVLHCGAPSLEIEGEGWICEHEHRHLTYGSPAQQAEEREEAFMEWSYSLGMRGDHGEHLL